MREGKNFQVSNRKLKLSRIDSEDWLRKLSLLSECLIAASCCAAQGIHYATIRIHLASITQAITNFKHSNRTKPQTSNFITTQTVPKSNPNASLTSFPQAPPLPPQILPTLSLPVPTLQQSLSLSKQFHLSERGGHVPIFGAKGKVSWGAHEEGSQESRRRTVFIASTITRGVPASTTSPSLTKIWTILEAIFERKGMIRIQW